MWNFTKFGKNSHFSTSVVWKNWNSSSCGEIPCIEIWNFSTWQISSPPTCRWSRWQISGMAATFDNVNLQPLILFNWVTLVIPRNLIIQINPMDLMICVMLGNLVNKLAKSTVQEHSAKKHFAISTVLKETCQITMPKITVLLVLMCYMHCVVSTALLALCYKHGVISTVLLSLC